MLVIEKRLLKKVAKCLIPKQKYEDFKEALKLVDETKDLALFDILRIQDQHNKYIHIYYRMKKGKYRAIFYFENDNTYFYDMGKRETIYKVKLI